ncbi:hypothetical protein U7230_07750 [Carboxydochorda subterranea]|uniref:Ribonuclease VapC n=1 Tax=Carboxydichorda subterranea TaxID=3109565 RepID=A0ABZ1C1Q0_9FIRM|nr:hypothetical protein [Limnochorda sp. L945t]WRP18874.1 hypothetical protein U7230_07750 [Limnochorda sp. L945t]
MIDAGIERMTTWLLDTNIVLYLLTRPEHSPGAPAAAVDPHLRALYRALDAFIDRVGAAGDRLLLTPLVVLETVATLQHAAVFQLPAAEAAERVLRLAQAPEVECEQRECVIAALSLQALGKGDMVDEYLVCRARETDVHILSNDRELCRRAAGKAVWLRDLVDKAEGRGRRPPSE